MLKYTKIDGRKPIAYRVEFDGRIGEVFRTGDTARSRRWHLDGISYNESKDCPSRRAAFHYFKCGEKFVTKPVFSTLGGRKGTQRIR